MKNYLPFLLFPIFFLLMLLSRSVDGATDAKEAAGLPDAVAVEDLNGETKNPVRKSRGRIGPVQGVTPNSRR